MVVPVPPSQAYDRMKFMGGRLYISFQGKLVVYAFSNSSLSLNYSLVLPHAPVSNMDMSTRDGLLCYSVLNSLVVLAADYSVLYSLSIGESFVGVKLMPSFIYATTRSLIYQIDLDVGRVIGTLALGPTYA